MTEKWTCDKCGGEIKMKQDVVVTDTWTIDKYGDKLKLEDTTPIDNYGYKYFCSKCDITTEQYGDDIEDIATLREVEE